MTDATIELNDPEHKAAPSKLELAKKAAEKRAKEQEEEQRAVKEARAELLTPDPVDVEAI